MKKVAIQGYKASFHAEAARKSFGDEEIELVACKNFDEMAEKVQKDSEMLGVMAIENSIAGSLLQNYRILREHNLFILEEVYLKIQHNLIGLPGTRIEDLKQVASHPMALKQCLDYFKEHPKIKLVESQDTSYSAEQVALKGKKQRGAIASLAAAQLYGLEVLAEAIETHKINYTRFVVIQNKPNLYMSAEVNKASIYIRVSDRPGSLLKVLERISNQRINISKLQSYPVLGMISEYFFYLDLEFDRYNQFESVIESIEEVTTQLQVLGLYNKASIYDHQAI